MFANNTRLQVMVVLPALLTAVAIYLALVIANRVLQRYMEESGWGGPVAEGAGNDAGNREVLVREIGGVVEDPGVLEMAPPPSPDRVVAELYRERAEAQRRAVEAARPVLMPVLEPEPIELRQVELAPLPVPGVVGSEGSRFQADPAAGGLDTDG